jgi:glycosyltransferase involved in cell wall biosynthesis
MSSKHILLLASWYPNTFTPFNGDFVQRMAESIALHHKVTVLHFHADPSIRKKMVKIDNPHPMLSEWRVYTPQNIFSKLSFLLQGHQIVNKIEKERGKIDHCYVQVIWKMGFLALWLKYTKGLSYAITEHWTGYLPQNYQLSRSMYFWSKIIGNQAQAFSCVSLNLAQKVHALGLYHSLPKVLPNIIDYEKYEAQDYPAFIPHQFVHVSNFRNSQKNTEGIVRSFLKVLETRPELTLMLIGGELETEKEKEISRASGGKIQVIKAIPHVEVLAYVAQSACLICFSNYETFAITCAEALCLGTPVIYTPCGGPEEYIEPAEGILVEIGNEAALHDAILAVYDDYSFDRSEIAKNARQKFNKTAWYAQFDAWIASKN